LLYIQRENLLLLLCISRSIIYVPMLFVSDCWCHAWIQARKRLYTLLPIAVRVWTYVRTIMDGREQIIRAVNNRPSQLRRGGGGSTCAYLQVL
jgi:hypothetical protein